MKAPVSQSQQNRGGSFLNLELKLYSGTWRKLTPSARPLLHPSGSLFQPPPPSPVCSGPSSGKAGTLTVQRAGFPWLIERLVVSVINLSLRESECQLDCDTS